MSYIQAIVMGIVEGITEFLPISSTGHLILTADFLNIPQTNFLKSFQIAIQFGAILAVVFLYWKRIFLEIDTMKKILTAFVPTGIIGFIFYDFIRESLISNKNLVAISLVLGGLVIIFFEKFLYGKKSKTKNINNISYFQAIFIGFFQAISIIPGISRSAATVIGGLIFGISRRTIVEFSFILAVPTMAVATVFDLFRNIDYFNSDQLGILGVGFLVSFLMAILAIKFLLNFVKKYSFVSFGVYRIVIGILLVLFLL